jgi:hypothetical protein
MSNAEVNYTVVVFCLRLHMLREEETKEEVNAVKFEFSPEVRRLLERKSSEKVYMHYDANPFTWSMPVIMPRPPYYASPRYEWNYPRI